MKTLRVLLLTLVLSVFALAKTFAQDNMEDVIYLKNGSIYRGMIIETVPNVSYKIKIMGGSVFVVGINEIEKIAKEEKPFPRGGGDGRYGGFPPFPPMHRDWNAYSDSMRRAFNYRRKGRFMLLQVLLDNKQGGVHLVDGYKFNTHAALGLGVGADFVFSSPFNERINNIDSRALNGVYVPFFLHLEGDMAPHRVTPFYTFEAGYFIAGLQRDRNWNDASFRKPDAHGPTATAGLGVKFNSSRGLNFSILFHVNVKNVNYKEDVYYYDPYGNYYTNSQHRNATLVIPGIRFGFGFTAAKGGMHHMRMGKE